MNRNLSVWLDIVRFAAAVAVFLGHARSVLAPDLPKILSVHSAEAVAVFFVLSGFVIRYVTKEREVAFSEYASARAIRILSVAVPTLLLTYQIDAIGESLNPSFYTTLRFWNGPLEPAEFVQSLSFLGEAWGRHVVPGSNEPYWSLGYEVPYYIAFAGVFIRSRLLRWAFWLLWAVLYGPFIVAYMALWLMGAALYEVVARVKHESICLRTRSVAVALLCAPALYPVLKYVVFPPMGSIMRIGSLSQYAIGWSYYGLIALLFAAHLYGFSVLTHGLRPFSDRFVRTIRWLAGATFTVYLMHMPIIVALAATRGTWDDGRGRSLTAVAFALVVLFVIAEFGERRKDAIKRLLSRLGRLRRQRFVEA